MTRPHHQKFSAPSAPFDPDFGAKLSQKIFAALGGVSTNNKFPIFQRKRAAGENFGPLGTLFLRKNVISGKESSSSPKCSSVTWFTDPATHFFLPLDPAAYIIPQNLTRPQELRRPQIDPATRKNPEMTRPRGRLGRVMTRPHASLVPPAPRCHPSRRAALATVASPVGGCPGSGPRPPPPPIGLKYLRKLG